MNTQKKTRGVILMLTREECENALMDFEMCYRDNDMSYSAFQSAKKDVKVLWKLIREHFDKETPLKADIGMFASVRCHKCGAKVNKPDNYCSNCGQKLDWRDFNV